MCCYKMACAVIKQLHDNHYTPSRPINFNHSYIHIRFMKMSLMFFKLHMQPTALLCELENKCKVTIIHYAPKIYLCKFCSNLPTFVHMIFAHKKVLSMLTESSPKTICPHPLWRGDMITQKYKHTSSTCSQILINISVLSQNHLFL